MTLYGYAIFEPEFFIEGEDDCWVISYYRCYSDNKEPAPSQSHWIVPGTISVEN